MSAAHQDLGRVLTDFRARSDLTVARPAHLDAGEVNARDESADAHLHDGVRVCVPPGGAVVPLSQNGCVAVQVEVQPMEEAGGRGRWWRIGEVLSRRVPPLSEGKASSRGQAEEEP